MKGFFRELDYTLPWEVEAIDDAMPVEIDALQEWAVGDRLLNDLMRGVDLGVATDAEWRRGILPPGRLGWRKAGPSATARSTWRWAALRPRGTHPATGHDIDVDLGDRRVTGTVAPVYGDRTVSVTYSRLAAKHLLQAWISLVALGAQRPEREWEAYCVGRRGKDEIQGADVPAPRGRDGGAARHRRDLRRRTPRTVPVAAQDVVRVGTEASRGTGPQLVREEQVGKPARHHDRRGRRARRTSSCGDARLR